MRLHQGVYCYGARELGFRDRVHAARLALPPEARTTGATRLRELGVRAGSPDVLHFVVQGDLHLTLEGVFLHRTVKLPPADDHGVSPEAALVAYAARARMLDAIAAGCELTRLGLLDEEALWDLLDGERWRRGVRETRSVMAWLDGRCRSMPEAELLTLIRAAGLPEPEVNEPILVGGVELTPDFRWARWRRVVEYEGAQHQTDRSQYTGDIDRYALMRRHSIEYLQVTRELLRLPVETVRRVHRLLAEGGYDGPAPVLGKQWVDLFRPLRDVVRRDASAVS